MSVSNVNAASGTSNIDKQIFAKLLKLLILSQPQQDFSGQSIFGIPTGFNQQSEADFVAATSESAVYRILGLQIPTAADLPELPATEE